MNVENVIEGVIVTVVLSAVATTPSWLPARSKPPPIAQHDVLGAQRVNGQGREGVGAGRLIHQAVNGNLLEGSNPQAAATFIPLAYNTAGQTLHGDMNRDRLRQPGCRTTCGSCPSSLRIVPDVSCSALKIKKYCGSASSRNTFEKANQKSVPRAVARAEWSARRPPASETGRRRIGR